MSYVLLQFRALIAGVLSVLCLAVFSQPRKILQIIVKTRHSVCCQIITKVDVIMYPKTITVLAYKRKKLL